MTTPERSAAAAKFAEKIVSKHLNYTGKDTLRCEIEREFLGATGEAAPPQANWLPLAKALSAQLKSMGADVHPSKLEMWLENNAALVGNSRGEAAPPPQEWMIALREYAELREEIGRNEETGDCACDAYNFHKCQLCGRTDGLEQRCRALMNNWADTWAMRLFHAAVVGEAAPPPQEDEKFAADFVDVFGGFPKDQAIALLVRRLGELRREAAPPTPQLKRTKCPKCDELLDGNGLLYWCESGHVYDAPEFQAASPDENLLKIIRTWIKTESGPQMATFSIPELKVRVSLRGWKKIILERTLNEGGESVSARAAQPEKKS